MVRRAFLLYCCFASQFLYSARTPPNMSLWSKYDVITLKINQVAWYDFVIDGVIKTLKFRWTLYVNKGLVMLYNYEKFPFQNILYLNYQLEGYRINLKNRAENAYDYPYVMIVFVEFDDKKQEAMFELFVKDDKRTILLERKAPKDE